MFTHLRLQLWSENITLVFQFFLELYYLVELLKLHPLNTIILLQLQK